MATLQKIRQRDAVEQFIDKVHTIMKREHLSLSEVARRADVARPYLTRVLSGEHDPTMQWAQRVADALGFEIICK